MKKVSNPAIGILLVSFIAIGLLLVGSSDNKAYAYGREGRMMGTRNMIRGDDRNEMVNMMKQHHGNNWQEHCNKMMKEETL